METFQQPKITGYRQLTEEEVALMNEAKALAQQVGDFVNKLNKHPATFGGPVIFNDENGNSLPSLDKRWISIGTTDLQRGFMAIVRAIAQPTTF